MCSRQELTVWHCAPNHVALIIKSFRHQSEVEDYTEIVLPTLYLFHLHHLLLGIWKERTAYIRDLPMSGNVFNFSLNTKSFFLQRESQCFFKTGLYKFRHFLFLVEVFCKRMSSYHFSSMFRLRSTNNLLDTNEKPTSVKRRGLQNDLLSLHITNLFTMTQGFSKFSAHRSDAGPYKSVSPSYTTCIWRGCPRHPPVV